MQKKCLEKSNRTQNMEENTLKMINGELYNADTPELHELRLKASKLQREFNALGEDDPRRKEILIELLGHKGEGVFFRGPIFFDYGFNTYIGDHSYANYNLTILDVCPVHIGNNVLMATNVSILTALHPIHADDRRGYFDKECGYFHDNEYGKPITIEDDVWIGGSVTICPGVTIGKGSVIGAGSVVIHDIPSYSLAVGNPCRVIRKITDADRIKKPNK